MKTIINKTILKQGENTYTPVEVDGVIYWVGEIIIMKNLIFGVKQQKNLYNL
jgi:hypothetical protein